MVLFVCSLRGEMPRRFFVLKLNFEVCVRKTSARAGKEASLPLVLWKHILQSLAPESPASLLRVRYSLQI